MLLCRVASVFPQFLVWAEQLEAIVNRLAEQEGGSCTCVVVCVVCACCMHAAVCVVVGICVWIFFLCLRACAFVGAHEWGIFGVPAFFLTPCIYDSTFLVSSADVHRVSTDFSKLPGDVVEGKAAGICPDVVPPPPFNFSVCCFPSLDSLHRDINSS